MSVDKDLEIQVLSALTLLREYCEDENFKGWDPYDGLNSCVFQRTPLKDWDLARLVLIQACKRSSINFRTLLGVPKQRNAKGIGLFLNGYSNLLRLAKSGDHRFGTVPELTQKVRYLAELLIQMQTPGYSGACWGYNFDWQARRIFYFPAHTPTVVATAFCASALFNASSVLGNSTWTEVAISSGEFILEDLTRTSCNEGFLFSYSPIAGNDTVYNAALLGAKTLSLCFAHTRDARYKKAARAVVSAACSGQEEDGSWVYGLLPVQSWKDSFHTGYNLDAIAHYRKYCDDDSFDDNLSKGFEYYTSTFFLPDGTPKYYSDRKWPIDIHCPGQLIVTSASLGKLEEVDFVVSRVLRWCLRNMQSRQGYFYYQLKRGFSSKISYMRWSNAFMFNALTYYFLGWSKKPADLILSEGDDRYL